MFLLISNCYSSTNGRLPSDRSGADDYLTKPLSPRELIARIQTSLGGDLLGDGQMSSLRWLEAGATASYGAVSEPCNFWQKFPNPTVLLRHYVQGASAIEEYWESVAWPTQGIFIGEPLAAPYRGSYRQLAIHTK